MEMQETQKVKTVLRKKNNVGGLTIFISVLKNFN